MAVSKLEVALTIMLWLSVFLSILGVLVVAICKYVRLVSDREYSKRQRFNPSDEWSTEPEQPAYKAPIVYACLVSWFSYILIYLMQ